jgi:hypothetical protein
MNYFSIGQLVNWVHGLVDHVHGSWLTRSIGFIKRRSMAVRSMAWIKSTKGYFLLLISALDPSLDGSDWVWRGGDATNGGVLWPWRRLGGVEQRSWSGPRFWMGFSRTASRRRGESLLLTLFLERVAAGDGAASSSSLGYGVRGLLCTSGDGEGMHNGGELRWDSWGSRLGSGKLVAAWRRQGAVPRVWALSDEKSDRVGSFYRVFHSTTHDSCRLKLYAIFLWDPRSIPLKIRDRRDLHAAVPTTELQTLLHHREDGVLPVGVGYELGHARCLE